MIFFYIKEFEIGYVLTVSNVNWLEKVAEQRYKIPPLPKKSVAPSCQSSDDWMFGKTVKWCVGEGPRHSVTARKASFKALYI